MLPSIVPNSSASIGTGLVTAPEDLEEVLVGSDEVVVGLEEAVVVLDFVVPEVVCGADGSSGDCSVSLVSTGCAEVDGAAAV